MSSTKTEDAGRHPDYGPCDGFGPGRTCSACTGLAERQDGAVIETGSGKIVVRPPLRTRLKAAWKAFNA